MISQLYIENVAVIEKAEIHFTPEFNVLTGETGAGKSIVIDSLHAILGERILREIIRSGARSAFVSAVFQDVNQIIIDQLQSLGYPIEEDGSLLIQREISLDGKNACRINGRPATVSVLKELAPFLINIHGQHESYHLLSSDLHIHYIDKMGELEPLCEEYRNSYQKLLNIKKQLEKNRMDEGEKARKIDLLTYQIDELKSANLRVGEQQELLEKRNFYLNSEKVASAIKMAKDIMNGDEYQSGVLSSTSQMVDSLSSAELYLPSIHNLVERLEGICYDLEDCKEELTGYASNLEFDPSELEEVENRLDLLYRLEMKYGSTEESMLDFLDRCVSELSEIELSDERIADLEKEFEKEKIHTENLANTLSKKRREIANIFTKKVKEELVFLDMPNVNFQVEQNICDMGINGIDKIQFLLSTNPGEPVKPISKIASGGELSRIMLAIKTVLAGKDEIDTLIFDEVDTGISGSAAQKVGLKLREVSKNRQVICVTHLAQIAALGNSHFLIQKHTQEGRTFTEVLPLNFEQRKREIARIMGGTEITPLMLKNAEEMLRNNGISLNSKKG